MCRSVAVVLGLIALIAQDGAAQGTTSSITGHVLDGRTLLPVAGATVFASTLEETQSQQTNRTGEFAFTFSRPVQMRLWADKPYFDRAQGSTIDVPPGARINGVVLKLSSTATITGRVSRGTEPVAGARVQLLRREWRGSGFRWSEAPLHKGTRSDARGFYRIAGLQPGSYLVAIPDDGQLSGPRVLGSTFAPGTRVAARATVFTLAAGTETIVDVQQQTNEPVGSVTGQIRQGDRGTRSVTVRLRRMTADSETATDLDEIGTVTDDSGTFRFADVPIGAYKLRAVQFPKSEAPLANLTEGSFGHYALSHPQDEPGVLAVGQPVPPLPAAPTLYAERDVRVEARSADLTLIQLQPAASISGRLVFQDGPPPAPEDLLEIPVLIRPATGEVWGDIPQARIERDGTFRSPGLPPGDYVIVPLFNRVRPAQRWNTIALTSGGTDVLGGAITLRTTDVADVVVTLSPKSAAVSGTVRRSNLPPAAVALWARVIIFPRSERSRTHYTFPNPRRVVQAPLVFSSDAFQAALPPGEYLIAAIGDELPQFWMTPDYLVRLVAWATPIKLGVGEKLSVSLEARSIAFAR